MATKFYLHATTSGLPSGTLPTDEQSSLTPDANDFEGSRTTNRLMNTTIGVSQANLTNTSTADTNAHNYYVTRFVSPVLWQGNISAQTWTVEYAAKEANAAANFPRNGAGVMYVNCYIWKPSDGTKVGTILDGNSNADGEEAGTTQTVINFTFSGAAVTGLTPGDAVLVFEVWAQVTQGNGTARVQDFYYDGTTENSTTNEAAFLSTPEDLQFSNTPQNMTIVAAGGSGTSTANTTQFLSVVGEHNAPTATEAEAEIVFRTAGTLSRLGVRLSTNGISGGTTVFTLRKNGVDQSLTVSFGASATGYQEDLTHTVSVSAGDKICLKSVPGGATGTFLIRIISLGFVATSGDAVQILGNYQSNAVAVASTTRYYPLTGRFQNTSTEASTKVRQRTAGTYAKLMIYVSANARTNNTTFKSRKNGSDGNLSITIGAGATGVFEDTSNSDTVVPGDDYNLATTLGTGTESITYTVCKVEFTSVVEMKGILETANTGSSADIAANTTTYLPIGGSSINTTDTNAKRRIRNGKILIDNLHVYVSTNTVTADSTVTLRVNGVDTALAVTITNATTGLFVDTSDVITAGAVDDINLKVVTGATGTSLRIDSVTLYYRPAPIDFNRTVSESSVSSSDSINRVYGQTRRPGVGSILLDGSDDYVQCGNHSDLWSRALTKFSFSVWVYTPTNNPSVDKYVVSHGNSSVHGFRLLWDDTTGKFQFLIKNSGGSNIDAVANSTQVAGIWSNYIAVYDNTLGSQNLKLYRDKSVQTDTGDLTESPNLSDELTLGTEVSASTPACNVKDFRFWKDKALTQTEVDDVVDNKSSAPIPDYWLMMNECGGNPSDRVGGKTTTLTNGATWHSEAPAGFPSDWTISSESINRMTVSNRPLSTETVTISENLQRVRGAAVAIATQTVTVGESLLRMLVSNRSLPETTSIGETLLRMLSANRPLSTETTTVGDNLTRLLAVSRTLSTETVTIGESINRMLAATRSLPETTNVSEQLNRKLEATRTLPENTAVSDNLTRLLSANRALATEVTAVSDSLNRMVESIRSLPENVAVSDSLNRMLAASRILDTEVVTINETLQRMLAATRTLQDTTSITEDLDTEFTSGGGGATNYNRSITEDTTISESLERMLEATRILNTETTSISDDLNRMLAANRAIASESTPIGEILQRLLAASRTLQDSVTTNETLQRLVNAFRTLQDNITIDDSINRTYSGSRPIGENTSIIDSLTTRLSAFRTLIESIITSDSINRTYSASRPIQEDVSIIDSLSLRLSAFRTMIENVGITDLLEHLKQSVNNQNYIVNLIENVLITDKIRTWLSPLKIFKSLKGNFRSEGVRTESQGRKMRPAGWFRSSFYTYERNRNPKRSSESEGQ